MAEIRQGVDHDFELDTTLALLQQDLTAIAPEEAIALLGDWQQQLQGNPLVDELENLKQAILAGNGEAIALQLTKLSQTIPDLDLAANAEIQPKMQQLSQALLGISQTILSR